jgi:Flp pilus assembly protein TadD
VKARYNLGVALHARGDLDGALTEFRRVTAVKRDYADAHYAVAEILRQRGEKREAVESYRTYLSLEQESPSTHARRESVKLRLKELGG